MIRAVLDTNVLVSGFVSYARPERAPAQLLHRWQAGEFDLVVSDTLLRELETALTGPYFSRRITSEEVDEARHLLQTQATWVRRSVDVFGVASHPEDDLVLATAVSAGADFLVTGDRQLLRLIDYRGVRLISARQFLDVLEANTDEP